MPESQHTEYKRQWKDDLLKWLCAFANAFFCAGLIESWGRGIERITEACAQDGDPTPVWALEPGGWWVTFTYPAEAAEQVTPQVELNEASAKSYAAVARSAFTKILD